MKIQIMMMHIMKDMKQDIRLVKRRLSVESQISSNL